MMFVPQKYCQRCHKIFVQFFITIFDIFLFKNKIEDAIFVYYAGPNFIIPENRIVKFYQSSKNIEKTIDVRFSKENEF